MVLLGLRQLGDLAPRLQHKLPLVIVTSERPCSRRTCAIRSIEVAADDNSPSVEVNARQRRTEQRGVHEDGEAFTGELLPAHFVDACGSPTLRYLDRPQEPQDRGPRLEIAFGVNGGRWLVATVHDLLTRKELIHAEPVVMRI